MLGVLVVAEKVVYVDPIAVQRGKRDERVDVLQATVDAYAGFRSATERNGCRVRQGIDLAVEAVRPGDSSRLGANVTQPAGRESENSSLLDSRTVNEAGIFKEFKQR